MLEVKPKRDLFIEENLGLVHSVCKRFSGRGVEYDDLFQAGCIGLIKAADAFDEERGFCFSTYAVPVIMGEIRRIFRDGGSVKVSRSVKELGIHINREKNILEQKLNREPTVSEIAGALGVSKEQIAEAICASQPTVSLTYKDDGMSEADLPIINNEEQITNKLDLDKAFLNLSPQERVLIKCRYYKFMTQSQTAEILKMTQVQVSRAEKKVLMKLRDYLD
ncbi:MAG: sigma-70 family RNA polymerase sigma factor [Ruminococcaceae bacterium]|nr:sigma-70 family RNA polymerase sigma factor [Oscillospiraceae bacterium]